MNLSNISNVFLKRVIIKKLPKKLFTIHFYQKKSKGMFLIEKEAKFSVVNF